MRRLQGAVLLLIATTAQADVADELLNLWYMQDNYHWVSFKPQPPATPVPNLPESLAGRMLLPAVTPAPAVLLLHGSAGVDSRGPRYAETLRRAGFVTLEVDIWQAMGVTAANRPRTVQETMPSVWGALAFLATRPEVDAQRIGALGFSWGGVQTLLAAREPVSDTSQPHFAAFAALYPVCWAYNRVPGYQLTSISGPLQIGIGDKDDYDLGAGPCQALGASLTQAGGQATVKVYRDSYHGFDRLEPTVTVSDPYSHRGAGGMVMIQPNYFTGFSAMQDKLQFFRQHLLPH